MTKDNNNSVKSASGTLFQRIAARLWPARDEKRRLQLENTRMQALLNMMPCEFCGWSKNGVRAASLGISSLVGCDIIEKLTDIQGVLAPGDAAALETLYERLETQGEVFELSVSTADGQKAFKIHGAQGQTSDNGEIFNILWFFDITAFARAAVDSAEAVVALEKREAEFQNALNTLPMPVWLRKDSLDIQWCNRAYARAVDDSQAAVIADQKELPLSGQKKGEKNPRILAQRALGEQKPQVETHHMVVEGHRRLVETHELPMSVQGMVMGYVQDITRLEDLEQELVRFQDSNKEVLEQLRTAIAIFDADTTLEFYNTAYGQLWGLDEKWLNKAPRLTEILEKLRENRSLPEQADFRQFRQGWVDMFTSLLEPAEEMVYLPDGKAIRTVVVPRPTGGLLVTYEDVTSRLELESSYNTLIAVQQETLANLAEGLAVFGGDGRLQLSNPSYARIWGLKPENLEGNPHISQLVKKMEGFFEKENWPDMSDALTRNGLERSETRGRIERADGVILEYSIVPLPDGNVLNAYIDITDSVRVEQALIEKNAALEEAERVKLDFLANVSYQLRTPLNAIMGFSEILNEQYFGDLNEKQIGYTQNIIESGDRLVTLVDNILDLSTIEAGYLSLTPEEVDIPETVKTVCTLVEEWARKQDVQLKVKCPKSVGSIIADGQRVKQVLLNLLRNAINFSNNGGTITVSGQRTENDIVLKVTDEGAGIPPEDLARVFQPFERSKDKKGRGAGLGLSLVRNIVELHGGTIEIESVLEKGTTVTCVFPLKADFDEERAA